MTSQTGAPQGRLWFNRQGDRKKETYVITLWPYRSLSLKGFRIFMAKAYSDGTIFFYIHCREHM